MWHTRNNIASSKKDLINRNMKTNKLLFFALLLLSLGLIVSCSDDDDDMMMMDDDGEEEITEVVLTFTPITGGDVVTTTWSDPDGEGAGEPTIGRIQLLEGVAYNLSFTLTNTLADPDEDITAEIASELDEHQFFFGFTEGIFSTPSGNGNIDNRDDEIIYNDQDGNGLPVGLATTWTTGTHTEETGEFRVILKHQPDLKTETSDVNVGGTDIDITFPIDIVEEGNEEEEVINEVVLTFTPEGGGDDVVATWFDADGDGVGNPTIDDIDLEEGIQYTLAITLANTLEGEDITAEILDEDDEHQFFFAFTENIFADPMGDGNFDNAADPLNYEDEDDNGLPVGLSTSWQAGGHTEEAGEFRVVLKHQPGLKSATSDATVGGTDIDITFPLNIEEDPNEEEEVINQVVLTFSPAGGGDDIVATWFDADGDGVGNPTIDDIDLEEGIEYTMAITLANTLEGEDITAEIMEEDDEHQFFFGFTENIFADPMGDGNIDNGDDPLNYEDQDENGLPVGLSTSWQAGGHTEAAGEFRVILKHQPGLKTATSDATVGGTDIDITFALNIEEDPNEEEEVINQVVLTFTPDGGGDAITATWFDADGDGVGNPTIDDIDLAPNTTYEMAITLTNTLEDPDEDITAEIEEEDDEHMFFFAFTADVFTNPAGDGNVDNRDDALVYNDEDENGLPVGLSTNWTTGAAASDAEFRVVLKHQPGLKTATSDATVGGTDIDIEFTLNIQ